MSRAVISPTASPRPTPRLGVLSSSLPQASAPVTAEQHRENGAYSLQAAQTPEPEAAEAAQEEAQAVAAEAAARGAARAAEEPEEGVQAAPLPKEGASKNSR